MRFRLRNRNRSDNRQEESDERGCTRRFGCRGKSQRVVEGAVRLVLVAVLVMARIGLTIVMKVGLRNAANRVKVMCFGGKMRGDVIDVEGEQQRREETPPPTRLFWQATRMAWRASGHNEWARSYTSSASVSTLQTASRRSSRRPRPRPAPRFRTAR